MKRDMVGQPQSEIDSAQRHLGPIWLQPGIAPINVIALFFCGMMAIVYVTASGVIAPYLLNEHLGMPTAEQGDFTGNLIVIVEIISFGIIIPLGMLADKAGRRPVFIGAFMVICAAFIVWPLAHTTDVFIAVRVFMGVGFAMATLGLAAISADYPQNPSRGKMISINGIITGLGVSLIGAFFFAQLPYIFQSYGFNPIESGRFTLWSMATLAALAGMVVWIGVKEGSPRNQDDAHENLKDILIKGFSATRKNPRLSIAGVGYFVSRGDLLVMTTFFSLWIVAVGVDSGMETGAAQSYAGRMFGISQLALLIFFPIMGFLVDRFDRVTTLAISLGTAAAGYFALYIVGNPFESPFIILVAIMAGAGEAAVIVSCPALVGQEAPGKFRGAIIGLMGACGILGVLIHAKICGVFFDAISYQTPFLYMAGINAIAGVIAVIVRIKTGTSADVAARMERAVNG